jgi:hypothetical protein
MRRVASAWLAALAFAFAAGEARAQYDPVDRTNPGSFFGWWLSFAVPSPSTQCGRHGHFDRTTVFVMRANANCGAPPNYTSDRTPDDIILRFTADWNRSDEVGPTDEETVYIPPIRREIARLGCMPKDPSYRARIRELPRVAGLPAFECRVTRTSESAGAPWVIGLNLYRGSRSDRDPSRPPYPVIDYVFDIVYPKHRAAEAEHIYRQIAASIRFLPQTNPIIPY